MTFEKKRTEFLLNNKVFNFGFKDANEMIKHEIELMNYGKLVYPYIPKVIKFENNILTVEKIDGINILEYLIETRDFTIFNKMEKILNNFSSNYFWLKTNYSNNLNNDIRKNFGFLWYFDFSNENFIIDKDKNIWFIDWDLGVLNPNNLYEMQYFSFETFKKDLLLKIALD
jgi:hypothetical protein